MANKKQEKWVLIRQQTLTLFSVPCLDVSKLDLLEQFVMFLLTKCKLECKACQRYATTKMTLFRYPDPIFKQNLLIRVKVNT
jgi:hypothetical protein